MADIIIVNPRFDISFWGMERCMGTLGRRANLPVSCLALLAALVPEEHDVAIIDENVEEIDFDRLGRADMVCLTGMCIQAERMREILTEVRARGVMTVVGGPMATVEPEGIEDLADVLFLGEADFTFPQFVREWSEGRHASRYKQAEKTDMTTLPLPRVDLLKADRYMFGSLQISRGCPFTCEFCDIIVTFGRKPRLKTSAQVLADLDSFRRSGLKIVFVVDDNLIGNKKAIKPILRDIITWQEAHGYPLTLFTEASLDLAEDEELMRLMGEAGFQSVFIGIESPNEEALKETKKLQNVRPRAGTLIERVHRIQSHGLDVWCGMIVGFDNDDVTAFHVLPGFLTESRIANALIGLLYAIPTTPLYDRLKSAGRIDAPNAVTYGTNVVPARMNQAEMREGYRQVMWQVYEPEAYFERIDKLFIEDRFRFVVHHLPYWQKNRWAWVKRLMANYAKFAGLSARLLSTVKDETLRKVYRRQLARILFERPGEPHILFIYAIKVAMHHHYAAMLVELHGDKLDVPAAAIPYTASRPAEALLS
ncbi:MAG: radical SAM protein [Alphaproteobacteria bacterium BRH_c36]|nr:MAG: radical SAM protein [Alphaproteobacteria bacterium BRH_c36]